MIDLQSDTVTKPTAGMYEAMVSAEVGDDMFGQDPTVKQLEALMMEICDKPAAVFACSGTQSNQMALFSHCRPGDELLINGTGHIARYEGGAPAILSGVTCRVIEAPDGMLDIADLEPCLHIDDQHLCQTRLVCLENTTNLGGGKAYQLEQLDRVCEWAHAHGLKVHMDGARLFNATVAQGYSAGRLLQHVDSVSICFSKGLGCPMGSMLLGDEELITRARRFRKVMGGALRQAGVVAGAAIYAMENNVDRLEEDHAHARLFAEGIASLNGIILDSRKIETNIIYFQIDPEVCTADEFVNVLRTRNVAVGALGKQLVRAVTHLDLSRADIETSVQQIQEMMATNIPEAAKQTSSIKGTY